MDPVLGAMLASFGLRTGIALGEAVVLPSIELLGALIQDAVDAKLHPPTLLAVVAGMIKRMALEGHYTSHRLLVEMQFEATLQLMRSLGGNPTAEKARGMLQLAYARNEHPEAVI